MCVCVFVYVWDGCVLVVSDISIVLPVSSVWCRHFSGVQAEPAWQRQTSYLLPRRHMSIRCANTHTHTHTHTHKCHKRKKQNKKLGVCIECTLRDSLWEIAKY